MNLTRFALKPSDIEKGMEEPEPKEEYSEEPKFVQGGTLLVSIFCK